MGKAGLVSTLPCRKGVRCMQVKSNTNLAIRTGIKELPGE